MSKEIDETLKNSNKIFLGGGLRPPKTPQNHQKRGFGGLEPPPKIIFFAIFQRFINLFGQSSFQRAFTCLFKCTLSRFMTFSIKLEFLAENL